MNLHLPTHATGRKACWLNLALAASALLLVACSSSVPSSTMRSRPPSTPTSISIGLLGASGCHPASPRSASAIGLTEVQGSSTNGSLWILLFADTRVGSDIKIVWRMTGTGDLHLVAIGPQGQHVAPDWGPQAHSGSNWNRPGDEWGAGFTMPVTGCWNLHASRADTSGDVWLIFTK
jgi:hypothetical protein